MELPRPYTTAQLDLEALQLLFTDVEPRRGFILVTQDRISETSENGIIKSDAQIEHEEKEVARRGMLLLRVGRGDVITDDIEEGDRVILQGHALPVWVEKREGYYGQLLDARNVVGFKI